MPRRPKSDTPPPLPTPEDIRAFVARSPGRVGKREIAREFGIGPDRKSELRALLQGLSREGLIAPAGHRRFEASGRLPDVMVLRVTGTDPDGDPVARPVEWEGDGPPPMILMAPERSGTPALAPGERVLARLKPVGGNKYEGRTIKRLSDGPGRVLGVFRPRPNGTCRLARTRGPRRTRSSRRPPCPPAATA